MAPRVLRKCLGCLYLTGFQIREQFFTEKKKQFCWSPSKLFRGDGEEREKKKSLHARLKFELAF